MAWWLVIGGSTGWHRAAPGRLAHDGGVRATIVATGRHDRDQLAVVMVVGESFVEPAGPAHRHVGRNLGREPVVISVTYLLPIGSPLAHDTESPGCAG